MYKCVLDIAELKAYLAGAKAVAFDFETAPMDEYREIERAALDPHKAQIVGVSFSVSEDSGVYLPLAHRVGDNADAIEAWEFIAEFATDRTITKIAHNLAFEAMFLYAQGIILAPPCYDTIAAAQLTLKNDYAFRGLSESGLKTLAPELLDCALPSFAMVTLGRHFDELSGQDNATIRYACADSDYALRLYNLFNSWFEKFLPKHRYIAQEIESPTAVFCGIMKYNGLLANAPLMREKQAECEDNLARLKQEIAFIIGDVNIGANASTSAFKNYLHKDLQLPILKRTEGNHAAADDESLILLADWCKKNCAELAPLFALVQEYRKWGKVKSTYIDGYLSHINPATGCIHADLLPLATETGRFAARNPNLQNMPRASADDVGVRNFFIAPEGFALLSLDFSQIELRVGAFYCKDEKMLKVYENGGDIHAQTTSVIYEIPYSQAVDKNAPNYKERRTIAKNCNFGTFFGLYPKGLQRTLKFKAGLDTPIFECEKIINNLKTGYPALTKWQEATKQTARGCGYSETHLGRRRYLPNIRSVDWGKKSFSERCALNTPIQGTAADILKLALGRIVEGLSARPWLRPLLQIHDELVFELPRERLNEAVDYIKLCMEEKPFEGFNIPIIAEASVGEKFGEMEEICE
jgi:DNA polymerase-1